LRIAYVDVRAEPATGRFGAPDPNRLDALEVQSAFRELLDVPACKIRERQPDQNYEQGALQNSYRRESLGSKHESSSHCYEDYVRSIVAQGKETEQRPEQQQKISPGKSVSQLKRE